MIKRHFLKSAVLTATVICMLLSTACSDDPTKINAEQTSSETVAETNEARSTSVSSVTETGPSETSPDAPSDAIAKINGGADEVGIYSIVVRLTDRAADKGVVEMVYYGAKGSPQENSIVNTFRIEY